LISGLDPKILQDLLAALMTANGELADRLRDALSNPPGAGPSDVRVHIGGSVSRSNIIAGNNNTVS
jgi:hypothetical protein